MSSEVPQLTYNRLRAAVAGNASAVRVIVRLEPAGGASDKVFPPTYEKGRYAVEDRNIGGRPVTTVLLDSVQSQANRLEAVLLAAFERSKCDLPVLSVQVPRASGPPTRVTVLDAPHRVTDAIFRDSRWNGEQFRDSPAGKAIAQARLDNATALFRYCPTALVFGFWDSQSGAGAHGLRVARALVSEIIGLDAVFGRRTGSRIDPLAISADAARIYRSEKDMWTLEEKEAAKDPKGKPQLYGKASKAGKPSAINHGNITPSVSEDGEPGGVTISGALQTTVLSLPQLRRLSFPDPQTKKTSAERDDAGRAVLAALALYAVALQQEEGYFLRSRCHLLPVEAPHAEFVGPTSRDVEAFSLATPSAGEVFRQAVEQAGSTGLTWESGFIELTPAPKLVELVSRSDDKVRVEGGPDDAGD